MAQFKAKIIKFGNSKGVVIPAKLLKEAKKELGDVITLDILLGEKTDNVITQKKRIKAVDGIIPKSSTTPFDICPKHKCFYKTCKC